MLFENVHRLPSRVDATHSSINRAHTIPSIAIRLSKMNCNITKHLPLSMQRQGELHMKKSSSLYAASKKSNDELRFRTIVYMQMVSLFHRTDNWLNGILRNSSTCHLSAAAFLPIVIVTNVMKFLYYPTNTHLMWLLCVKHGSTAQYLIQIFHYLVTVNLDDLIAVEMEVVFWLLLSRIFIACVDLNVDVLWLEVCRDNRLTNVM